MNLQNDSIVSSRLTLGHNEVVALATRVDVANAAQQKANGRVLCRARGGEGDVR